VLGTLTRALALLPPEMRGRWAALVPLLLLTAVLEAASAAARVITSTDGVRGRLECAAGDPAAAARSVAMPLASP
jgi:hypothetical protein